MKKVFSWFIITTLFIINGCSTIEDQAPINNADLDVPPICREVDLSASLDVFDLKTDFPSDTSSPYKLPWAAGYTYRVNQGNTSGFGHSGFWRYGYDFDMRIGTEILAARSGIVIHANDGTADGNPNGTNLTTILHADSTVALYSHLTLNGVLVESGDSIEQGDLIGLSGNTGNTGGFRHLHFSLHPCSALPGLPNETDCPTLPVTFSNTKPNPNGLGAGLCYEAEF